MIKFKGKSGYTLQGQQGERRWKKNKEPEKVHIVQAQIINPFRLKVRDEYQRQPAGSPGMNSALVIVDSTGRKYYTKNSGRAHTEISQAALANASGIRSISQLWTGERFGIPNSAKAASPDSGLSKSSDLFSVYNGPFSDSINPRGTDGWIAAQLLPGKTPAEMGMRKWILDDDKHIFGTVPTDESDIKAFRFMEGLSSDYDPERAAFEAGKIAYLDAVSGNGDGWALRQANARNMLLIDGIPTAIDHEMSHDSVLGYSQGEVENVNQFPENGIYDGEQKARRLDRIYQDLLRQDKYKSNKYGRAGMFGFRTAHKDMMSLDLQRLANNIRSQAFTEPSEEGLRNAIGVNPYLQEHLRKVIS